ncbi:MAG TPA: arsenic resistance N-acetyltransferase ArsN2 [Patescibacteria group bacterium]|nr:arsenic resistance N-acetyltransferase ArsN2 [Patescibacteria group bacterium]
MDIKRPDKLTVVADEPEGKITNPKKTFKIRQATLEDKECISSLLSGFKLPLDGLENSKMWVLQENNGSVQGVVGLEVWGGKGLLRSVAVNRNLQNRGYGASLVKHVINEAKKNGIHELLLLTTTTPNFFRKLGFKEHNREHVTGSITNSVEFKGACPKTAILMRLSLS